MQALAYLLVAGSALIWQRSDRESVHDLGDYWRDTAIGYGVPVRSNRQRWALLVLIALLVACTGRPRGRSDDDDDDDDDSAELGDDDDSSDDGTGGDGAYEGTVSGLISTSDFPALPCTGAVQAEVNDGVASGSLSCSFTLPCEGSWSATPVPSTTDLAMTDCLGDVAPLDLSWSGETLLGRVDYLEESKEFGTIEISISFDAFRAD